MTEETPLDDIENYKFPEQYLERLQEEEPNTPHYNIIQGQLYESMRTDVRFDTREALNVSTMLNNGEVEEASEFIHERLEE